MKKLLFLLGIMLTASMLSAQTCELYNTTGQSIRVRLVALRGSTEYFSDVILLSAGTPSSPTTVGPYTVASTNWPWLGATPPAGAYITHLLVEVNACSDMFSLDLDNPNYTSCAGTPDQFKSEFIDIGGLSVEMHND